MPGPAGIPPAPASDETHVDLLRWTLIFLVIALIAAVFGFGGVAAGAATIGKVLFFVFIVLFVISLIMGRGGRSRL
ncbi:MAG: DUF1328 domain-containing protein [Gluconacetobacter diazotrophicus]|nr:DUF1328 domain-containing protein [Gluconacetobacter diazotrophicus]